MRVCIKCQGEYKNEEIDSKFDICSRCMGYKIAENNANLIIPILNEYGIEYKKESWGNGEGLSIYLGRGIFLNCANAGGVYFEYDEEVIDNENY